jgi:Putative 2OG-Fe(II) oxygenase
MKGLNMYNPVRYDFIERLHENPDSTFVFKFENPTVLYHKVPQEFLDIIWSEINKIKQNIESREEFNHKLAGHIKNEYSLKAVIPAIENYIMALCANYSQTNDVMANSDILTNDVPLVLSDMWVNFQKKHEFNPIHDHSGVMSFVIWMKIPYDLKEELKVFPKLKKEQNHTSTFNFIFTDILGNIQNEAIPIDKTFEGVICLFPSKLRHLVNPFYTSDEERISVSGNVKLNTKHSILDQDSLSNTKIFKL